MILAQLCLSQESEISIVQDACLNNLYDYSLLSDQTDNSFHIVVENRVLDSFSNLEKFEFERQLSNQLSLSQINLKGK